MRWDGIGTITDVLTIDRTSFLQMPMSLIAGIFRHMTTQVHFIWAGDGDAVHLSLNWIRNEIMWPKASSNWFSYTAFNRHTDNFIRAQTERIYRWDDYYERLVKCRFLHLLIVYHIHFSVLGQKNKLEKVTMLEENPTILEFLINFIIEISIINFCLDQHN